MSAVASEIQNFDQEQIPIPISRWSTRSCTDSYYKVHFEYPPFVTPFYVEVPFTKEEVP